MRAVLAGVAVAALLTRAAFAATKLTPKEIQTEFFNGKPFTAATTSGTKFKMTFTPDGKVTREPQDKAGAERRRHLEALQGGLLHHLERQPRRTATRWSMSTRTNGRW